MKEASILLPVLLSLPILLLSLISFRVMKNALYISLIRLYIISFSVHFVIFPLYAMFSEYSYNRFYYDQDEIINYFYNLFAFLAGILVILFISDLYVYFKVDKLPSLRNMVDEQFQLINNKNAIKIFVVIMGFLMFHNIFFGFTYYGSGTLERNLSVPYFIVIIKSLSLIGMYGLMGYGCLHLIYARKPFFLGIVMLSGQIMLEPFQRRSYMMTILTMFFFKIIIDHLNVKKKEILLVLSSIFFITNIFFPFLFVFRQLTNESASMNKGESNFTKSYDIAKEGSRGRLLRKDVGKNLTYRLNQTARNMELMRYNVDRNHGMGGLLFASQLYQVVPRALNPGKLANKKLLSPEAMIFLFYGKKEWDVSDNLPLYGYLDFGFLGSFMSGIFQAVMLCLFSGLILNFHKIHPFLGLSTLTSIIYNHGSLEYSYSTELGLLRDFLILYLISWLIMYIYKMLKHKIGSVI